MIRQDSSAQRKEVYEGSDIRRNPYLVDYEVQRRRQDREYSRPQRRSPASGSVSSHRVTSRNRPMSRDTRIIMGQREAIASRSRRSAPGSRRQTVSYDLAPGSRPAPRRPMNRQEATRRRKQRILMQRLFFFAWVMCILLFAAVFVIRNRQDAARRGDSRSVPGEGGNLMAPFAQGATVQGLPSEKFAVHPEWTEDLLTPNEYSRPGNALESVNNIFVHYTANPGTSAAQNRSYFEWQKDTHEASVSAHFVIGYEGEIIQCVPLDEIAYAVMTRNYDSVSIECCYLEQDGSFTQATYDSLISLLAWLIDAYDLESGDILRHYDCGGKKCPLYYANHEDAWEQLKKDVDNL